MSKATSKFSVHSDFVADFCYNPHANVLLSAGGDATLCAYDLRNKKNNRQSDEQEAELQCVDCIKDGRKVICGTQSGVIIVFSWGRWGDCTDRYPGHPESVDCLLKVDESTVLTGSSDGLVRVVQIQPDNIIGVIGDHDTFPVEGMGRSFDGRVLCTYAHDDVLRFWDLNMFVEDAAEDGGGKESSEWKPSGIDTFDENEGMELDMTATTGKSRIGGEGSDMSEDSSSGFETASDSDSDDSCVGNSTKGHARMPTATENFFSDL